jgi:hypothetical protein
MRKNLIVVRAGDQSVHPEWLDSRYRRNFDVYVSYFGATPGRFRAQAEHYHAEAGLRWPTHDRICREQWSLLERYDYVAFVSDDVQAPQAAWNALFSACRRYRLDLAQPAIEGYASHEITRPQSRCILRYTNFVEIMCPIFDRAALQKLRGTFSESVSGWGLDCLWGNLLPYPQFNVAIIDAIPVRHARPQGTGSLTPMLAALGIDPREEMDRLLARHGIADPWPAEHKRVPATPAKRLLWRLILPSR